MFKYVLLTVFCMLGCGRAGDPDPTPTVNKPEQVSIDQDVFGFVEASKCDSTFLTGLVGSAGAQVDMTRAEAEPGKWWRRPVDYPECYANMESRSTISRDQLLGVYWWAWVNKDLPMLERMWEYGSNNYWRMGDGRYGGVDTVMNTAMISTLAQMIYALGGEDHYLSRRAFVKFSVTYRPGEAYVNRLTALHLMLRREVYKELSVGSEAVLEELNTKWPDNPLFALAARKYQLAADLAALDSVASGVHDEKEYVYERYFVIGYLSRYFPQ